MGMSNWANQFIGLYLLKFKLHQVQIVQTQNGLFQMGGLKLLGMVTTTSPHCNLYRIVVFPAPSSPSINIRISLVPHSLENKLENNPPSNYATSGNELQNQKNTSTHCLQLLNRI